MVAAVAGQARQRIRILSGGQSGVDRAALDVALALGLPCRGWCPKGRLAEDGPIAERYPVRETSSDDPAERTKRNVAEADALLVLHLGEPDSGTQLAIDHAAALGKPMFVVDLTRSELAAARDWLANLKDDAALNIAGPRESNATGVYRRSFDVLRRLLTFDDELDQLARP